MKVATSRKQLKDLSALFSYATSKTGDVGVIVASAYIVSNLLS